MSAQSRIRKATLAGVGLALALTWTGQVVVGHGDEEHDAAAAPASPAAAAPAASPASRARAASPAPGSPMSLPASSPSSPASLAPDGSLAPAASPAPGESLAPAASLAPGFMQASGIVLSVESPALGRVDSFVLLTAMGDELTFDMSGLPFDPAFPAAHIAEHQMTSQPVKVTFTMDGDRLMVIALADAE